MKSDGPHIFNLPAGAGLASPSDVNGTDTKRVKLMPDLESSGKFDLFGMRITSYHYVPSDNQSEESAAKNPIKETAVET